MDHWSSYLSPETALAGLRSDPHTAPAHVALMIGQPLRHVCEGFTSFDVQAVSEDGSRWDFTFRG